jgi:hypothetical protein
MQKAILTQDTSDDRQTHTVSTQANASLLSLDALYQQLHSSPRGLTAEEARKRLSQYGPNEPTAVRRTATLQQLLVFLANPLVLILLTASIITAILGEGLNASMQTLVLFIIRTTSNPLHSRPSLPLAITVLSIVTFGMLLPFTPLAVPLGFTPLPALYFLFLAGMIVMYLLLVEGVKRWLMGRLVK